MYAKAAARRGMPRRYEVPPAWSWIATLRGLRPLLSRLSLRGARGTGVQHGSPFARRGNLQPAWRNDKRSYCPFPS